MISIIENQDFDRAYSDALKMGPGRLRRVVQLYRICAEQGVPLPDAMDACEAALWADGALSLDTPSHARAWQVVTATGEAAYEAAGVESLPRIAVEAVKAAGGDPVETIRIIADRAKWFADSVEIAAAAREAIRVPALHGGFELVEAFRWGEPTEKAAEKLRGELADFSDLWAARDADDVLAALPEDGDFAAELMRRHRFLRPAEAQEIADRTLRRLAEPPARQMVVSGDDLFGQWAEPDAAAVALHEKAKRMMARLAGAEQDTSERPKPRHDPITGTLDLRRRLRTVAFDEATEFRPPTWLIKGIAPRTGIGLLYGESGAGKTFLAIHAALSVAWGLPFFRKRTHQGGVLYVAAEGGSGVLPRIRAANEELRGAVNAENLARKAAGMPPLARAMIRVVTEAPNLSRDGDARPLIATIEDAAADFSAAGHPLALVVIDTWHAALGGGDENSAADAGAALAPLREAAEAHGALALIVHHPGKDVERGARGSNALPAAADMILALSVPGHGGATAKPASAVRRATVTKLRDGEVGAELSYRLPIASLGLDDDGEPWTTCVVQPVSQPKTDAEGLTAGDRDFMAAMRAAIGDTTNDRVRVQEVRLRFYAGRGDAKADAKRVAFNRALAAATKSGRIGIDDADEWVWLN